MFVAERREPSGDALENSAARRFYAKFGFISLPKLTDRMFLPMRTAETLTLGRDWARSLFELFPGEFFSQPKVVECLGLSQVDLHALQATIATEINGKETDSQLAFIRLQVL